MSRQLQNSAEWGGDPTDFAFLPELALNSTSDWRCSLSGIQAVRISAPVAYILLYAALYAAFGVASPFWPRFFETRALSPQEIGIVLAAAMLTRLLAGPIVGSPMPVMAGGCLRAVLLVMLFCSWRLTTAWLNCHPLCCSYAHQFRTSTSG